MSFFAKVKQFLGIGTVSVKLQAPGHFKATDSMIDGTINLTAKSDQKVLSIKVELEESYETGRDENKKVQSFKLGLLNLNESFEVKTGEVKNIPFSLPFQVIKSSNDMLAEKGGVMGALGKMGRFADNQKSTYTLKVVVDLDKVSLDPSDSIEMKMIK